MSRQQSSKRRLLSIVMVAWSSASRTTAFLCPDSALALAGRGHALSFQRRSRVGEVAPVSGLERANTAPLFRACNLRERSGGRVRPTVLARGGHDAGLDGLAETVASSKNRQSGLSGAHRLIIGVICAGMALTCLGGSRAWAGGADGLHLGQRLAKSIQAKTGWPAWVVLMVISALPVVELRGGVPVGLWMGIPPLETFVLACIGNFIPVPFILLSLNNLQWLMKRVQPTLERKMKDATGTKMNWKYLAVFVGVPLPGTGAWTGAAIAALFKVSYAESLLGVTLGIIGAASIMTALVLAGTYGALAVSIGLLASLAVQQQAKRAKANRDMPSLDMRRSEFKAGPLAFVEWTTFVWFTLDALTHLSIELGYLYLALGVTAAKSDTWMGYIWREYGRADKRWAVRDSTVIALELLTVFVIGPLALGTAYAIYYRKPYRHVLQLSISVCELYGGFMTFVPDILDGAPNLATGDPLLLWVHLVFMNGVWVLVPAILVVESAAHLTHACSVAKTEERPNRELTRGLPRVSWFKLIAGTLLAYVVLVPFVVLVTANPPPAVS